MSGYWYTPYGGEPEWRKSPRCSECGALFKQTQVRSMEDARDNDVVAVVFCPSCPRRIINILKPSQAAIARGRELAARYGW